MERAVYCFLRVFFFQFVQINVFGAEKSQWYHSLATGKIVKKFGVLFAGQVGWNADLVEVGGFDTGKVSVYLGAGLFELFTGVSDNQLVHHGHQGWVEVCLTDQRIHQTTQINLATREYRSLVKAIFCLQPILIINRFKTKVCLICSLHMHNEVGRCKTPE